jgi:hypothetical protein
MPSNVPAAIRAAGCIALAVLLLKSTLLNEHLKLLPLGFVILAAFEGALIASALRIFLKDARPPRANVMHVDTRNISFIHELVITGGAVMFGWFGTYILTGVGAHEVWAGTVQARGPRPEEVVIGLFFLTGAFFGFYWRPTFTLDFERRTVRRFPFGRALPIFVGPERSTADLSVVAEGYFRTNTGIKLGEMIRGKLGKNTFELELIPGGENGNVTPVHLERRIAHWRAQLTA